MGKKMDQLTVTQPGEILAQDAVNNDQRLNLCAQEIQVALNKYGCALRALPQFTAEGRVVAIVQIIPAQ